MTGLSPLDDPLSGPYWQAAAAGQLVVQRCDACNALRWPPLVGCPECRSRGTTWVDVAPSGTIWSYVVYHRAFAAELKAEVPYTVAVVELDDGPHLIGRLIDGDRPPVVGDRVVAEFMDVAGVPSLRWRSTGERSTGNGKESHGST